MNYEIAKELKEAGFPQVIWRGQNYDDERKVAVIAENFMENEAIGEKVYIPALSELIEACGEQVFDLVRRKTVAGNWYWEAETEVAYGEGSTPEEAVANLWLALNKND